MSHPFPWLCSLLFKHNYFLEGKEDRELKHTYIRVETSLLKVNTDDACELFIKKTSSSHPLFALLNDMSCQASFFSWNLYGFFFFVKWCHVIHRLQCVCVYNTIFSACNQWGITMFSGLYVIYIFIECTGLVLQDNVGCL